MRKIGMDELRQKQMEVLDYVAAFCDENGIRYWIEGGTLLGAIQHKGYIPWDDDIDIAMLREDYTRFRKEFPEKSRDPKFVFRCAEDDKTWHLPFGKVMNTETLFLQDGHDLGINIDIFPMDDAPDDDALMDKMYRKRDRLKVLNAAQQNTGKPSGNVLRRAAVYCIRLVLRCFPDYYFIRKIAKNAVKYDGKGYENLGHFTAESKMKHLSKHAVDETIEVPFEDRTYKAPKGYDVWLRSCFGDYMQLPPEKDRKRHTYEAFVKEADEVGHE